MMNLARIVFFAIAFTLSSGPKVAYAAEVRAIIGVGLKATIEGIGPKFEQASGHKLILVFEPPEVALRRIRAGESFDLIVQPRDTIDALVGEKLAVLPATEIARSTVGLAVRKGMPRPDISTRAALKATLLAAHAVVHPDPARGGAGGVVAVKVFTQLGIADEMKAKTVYPRVPTKEGLAAEIVEGHADLLINQMQQLVQPTLDILGAFPEELDEGFSYYAAQMARASQPAAAQALIAYLRTPDAREALRVNGLKPTAP